MRTYTIYNGQSLVKIPHQFETKTYTLTIKKTQISTKSEENKIIEKRIKSIKPHF